MTLAIKIDDLSAGFFSADRIGCGRQHIQVKLMFFDLAFRDANWAMPGGGRGLRGEGISVHPRSQQQLYPRQHLSQIRFLIRIPFFFLLVMVKRSRKLALLAADLIDLITGTCGGL